MNDLGIANLLLPISAHLSPTQATACSGMTGLTCTSSNSYQSCCHCCGSVKTYVKTLPAAYHTAATNSNFVTTIDSIDLG